MKDGNDQVTKSIHSKMFMIVCQECPTFPSTLLGRKYNTAYLDKKMYTTYYVKNI